MAVDVAELYARYGPMVQRRCRFLLRNEEKAMEATQDVFVQVLRRADELEVSSPSSLLYRIATNVSLNRIRTAKRHPEHPDDELLTRIAIAGSTEERTLASALLERLFGAEKDSTATIAVMHLLDGFTLEEVAEEVGMSVSGVRKRLRGLRASLHELEGVV
ncbi:MAG: sigma-70 family RNA polymerase sigma factor [Myxococcales bacterium]|nr:sigma-70 family RNA polymerase sigma factor [Myxococcales bacterium]MCB9670484.1 sigma-70 family RNA polymerase sigma factor [Alphaproteobacteria bacterium]